MSWYFVENPVVVKEEEVVPLKSGEYNAVEQALGFLGLLEADVDVVLGKDVTVSKQGL
jgi:hypothetical protein